jgi:pilus assembly protein Flp/PilA
MLNQISRFLKDEEGASAVEYGLIVGLIAVAIVVVLGTMGTGMNNLFTSVSDEVAGAAGTGTPATR